MIDDKFLKRYANGLAKEVFEQGIELTVDTVDDFILSDEMISTLYKQKVLSDLQFKKLRKFFEERNPYAHKVAESFQATKYEYEPWIKGERGNEIKWQYHERLHTFLEDFQNFNPIILKDIADESKDIINLCGDPKAEGEWLRKGLVFGYVQSGKTTSYSDVIARGIDAGYKVFIILAGITNSLRTQTQERLEENIIGNVQRRDADFAEDKVIRLPRPFPMTVETDFKATGNNNIDFNHKVGTIFIVKKNKSILTNLLEELSKLTEYMGGKIDAPTLLIDDEADNATINTATPRSKASITAINEAIRALLNCFSRRVYVGYTATPFANIFIDHKSDEDMRIAEEYGKDLFPSDFIKSISAPDFYVGANRLFHSSEERVKNSLQHTVGVVHRSNYEHILPLSHKKSDSENIEELPSTLLTAVKYFFLFCAIEKARGRWEKHHTMMVNVSRFNSVQERVTVELNRFCKELAQAIILTGGDTRQKNELFDSLKDLYHKGAPDSQFSFQGTGNAEIPYSECLETEELAFDKEIIESLILVCNDIKVQTVNMQKQNQLVYPKKKDFQHVIAVGGLALSRGLTLEGLSITYILRNASASDTLMQMGRWFGYRFGYENLTRVFMPQTSFNHYSSIHIATEELRDELAEMSRQRLTPLDFGLKVRNSETGLMITAKNKLQNAEKITFSKDFSGKHLQAYILDRDKNIRHENENNIKEFLEKIIKSAHSGSVQKTKEGYILEGRGEDVLRLIEKLQFPNCPNFEVKIKDSGPTGSKGQSFIQTYIAKRLYKGLEKWRVCIPPGSTKTAAKVNLSGELSTNRRRRNSGSPLDEQTFKVTNGNSVAVGRDLEIGLTESQLKQLEGSSRRGAEIAEILGVPTIFIHFLSVELAPAFKGSSDYQASDFEGPYSSIGILFNHSSERADEHSYTANQVLSQQLKFEFEDMDQDEDAEELEHEMGGSG